MSNRDNNLRKGSYALLMGGMLSLGAFIASISIKKEIPEIIKEHNSVLSILDDFKLKKEVFYLGYLKDTFYLGSNENYFELKQGIGEYEKIVSRNKDFNLERLTVLNQVIKTCETKLDSLENLQEYRSFKNKSRNLGILNVFFLIGGMLGIGGSSSIYNKLTVTKFEKDQAGTNKNA